MNSFSGKRLVGWSVPSEMIWNASGGSNKVAFTLVLPGSEEQDMKDFSNCQDMKSESNAHVSQTPTQNKKCM